MEYFNILGERNSGTHFLKYALLFNFVIKESEIVKKHFFNDTSNFTENMDKTIYICIVRDPITWIDSFLKSLHHIPRKNTNINNLLKNEFYSVSDISNDIEIMEDRHIYTKERYKNIFELRKTKIDFFFTFIPNKVKHYYILKYEDLRDDYENVLGKLCLQFNLKKHHKDFVKTPKYKGTYNNLYVNKSLTLSLEIQEYIKTHVDIEQEHKLGYLLETTNLH